MTVTLTIADAAVPTLATLLRARGVAGATDAAVCQAFFASLATAEEKAATRFDLNAQIAAEQAKGVAADATVLKNLLYAEYQAKVS